MTIKILLVEDSPVALVVLKKILDSCPELQVVGTARTGKEALPMIPQLEPDIICTDLHMPQMNGLELTQEVMARYPRPIIVISASVKDDDPHNVFELLQAGALDVLPKPRGAMLEDYEAIKDQLINKIKVLAGVKVFKKTRKNETVIPQLEVKTPWVQPKNILNDKPIFWNQLKVIVIGASTGGPQALQEILSKFPAKFPVPIICVQHISEGFLLSFLDWLKTIVNLPIEIAPLGLIPQPGKIYFPPEQKHLELDNHGRFFHSNAPAVSGHRPSVNVTFASAAKFYGSSTLGILLTGMGRDGAEGMLRIFEVGGFTIAQDELTSVVFGMPQEAIKMGAVHQILSLHDIAPYILKKIN